MCILFLKVIIPNKKIVENHVQICKGAFWVRDKLFKLFVPKIVCPSPPKTGVTVCPSPPKPV